MYDTKILWNLIQKFGVKIQKVKCGSRCYVFFMMILDLVALAVFVSEESRSRLWVGGSPTLPHIYRSLDLNQLGTSSDQQRRHRRYNETLGTHCCFYLSYNGCCTMPDWRDQHEYILSHPSYKVCTWEQQQWLYNPSTSCHWRISMSCRMAFCAIDDGMSLRHPALWMQSKSWRFIELSIYRYREISTFPVTELEILTKHTGVLKLWLGAWHDSDNLRLVVVVGLVVVWIGHVIMFVGIIWISLRVDIILSQNIGDFDGRVGRIFQGLSMGLFRAKLEVRS